jgi:hypothetical protein
MPLIIVIKTIIQAIFLIKISTLPKVFSEGAVPCLTRNKPDKAS